MANNSTAFILPQWLLPKEPGMTCRPHSTIIGMLAVYNIVSTVVAVMTAGPFFYRQKQQFWSWKRRTLDRLLPWISCGSGGEEVSLSYGRFSFWPLTMSIIGSVAIALAAPLLAGISISRNHENANRWVLIEQWSTRPTATFFVVVINLIMALVHHHKEVFPENQNSTARIQEDGYLETALISIFTEFFVGFFGIKFLWDQAQIRSSSVYQPSTPCTTLGTSEGNPSNCPDMEIGANGLIITICLNGVLTIVLLLVLANKKSPMALMIGAFLTLECIFMYSWEIWASFLHRATDEMYCIESSTPLDVIYCLLPVFLGVWRLAWSARGRRESLIV
ncbi:hypothetical protein N431DRAFT_430625, partial [Stipitochalara longipes BDJ]